MARLVGYCGPQVMDMSFNSTCILPWVQQTHLHTYEVSLMGQRLAAPGIGCTALAGRVIKPISRVQIPSSLGIIGQPWSRGLLIAS